VQFSFAVRIAFALRNRDLDAGTDGSIECFGCRHRRTDELAETASIEVTDALRTALIRRDSGPFKSLLLRACWLRLFEKSAQGVPVQPDVRERGDKLSLRWLADVKIRVPGEVTMLAVLREPFSKLLDVS
jgi:hypothetical protein